MHRSRNTQKMTFKCLKFPAKFLLCVMHFSGLAKGAGSAQGEPCTIGQSGADPSSCDIILTKAEDKYLRVTSSRNESGHLFTSFEAFQNINSSSTFIFHFEQKIVKDVDGKDVLITNGNIEDELRFHKRSAKNVKVENDGRTARRKDKRFPYHAGVITNRPLMPNELFEVRLENFEAEQNGSTINIGVTTANPNGFNYPDWMYKMEDTYNIIVWNDKVSINGSSKDISNADLDDLEEKETVGVMRKFNGDLHIFINGKDMGCIAKNIPIKVYGCLDIVGKIVEVSILNGINL